jgi:hypothetical protein
MPYHIAVGLGPIDGIHTSARMWKKNKYLFSLLHEFVFKYLYTVRCNFWQPQGSHFTTIFGIGTPAYMEVVSDALLHSCGPGPNPWNTYLGRNVEKEKFLFFF